MSRDFTGMTDNKECNCELCFRPSEGDFCQLCFSIINSQQKVGINMLMHPDQIKDGLKLIPKKFKSNKNSWDFLAKQVSDTDDVKWARKYGESDIHSEFNAKELQDIISQLKKKAKLSRVQLRKLANGFILPDGTRLSIFDGKIALDGRSLVGKIPLITALELLSNNMTRQEWDIKKLLVGLSAITSQSNSSILGRPSTNPHCKNIFSLMEWILETTEHCEHESFFLNQAWARDVKSALDVTNGTELYTTLMTNRPTGLLEAMERKPWLYRWLENNNHQHLNYPVPKEMVYEKHGRLRFRKSDANNKQSSIVIPSDPRILAFLISMYLSPIDCKSSQRLLVVRENWNSSGEKPEIRANTKRSIEFLNSIIEDSNDRVEIIDEGILVRGMAGHHYLVKVGKGPHGAPYLITGLTFRNKKMKTHRLCIYNDQSYTKTPLGDHLGSAILALLNDVISAKSIDNLATFIIFEQPTPGFYISSSEEMKIKNPTLHHHLDKLILRKNEITWLGNENKSLDEEDIILFELDENNKLTTILPKSHSENLSKREEYKQLLKDGVINLLASRIHGSAGYREWLLDDPPFGRRANREFRMYMRRAHRRVRDRMFRGIHVDRDEVWDDIVHRHERREQNMIRFGRHKRIDEACFVGDPRYGQRRYCDLAVRFWNLLLGLRETCRFHVTEIPTKRGEEGERWNVRFNDCGFKFTIRSEEELDFFAEFAIQAGWECGECVVDRVWTKVRDANPSARNRLSVLLNRYQRKIPSARVEPWWWEFTDPTNARDLWGNIPWEMEEDLRDEGYRE